LGEWQTVDASRAATTLRETLAAETDPLAYDDLIEVFFGSPETLGVTGSVIAEDAARRASERQTDRQAGLAAVGLDALVRLSLSEAVPPWALYSLLEQLTPAEPTHFLIRALRRLALLYVHRSSADVRQLVRRQAQALAVNEELAADARQVLAQAELVDGLEAATLDDAEQHLREARREFSTVLNLDVNRIDAELLVAALDAVLSLVDHEPAVRLHEYADRIKQLGLFRRAWQAPGLPTWVGNPLDGDREWWTLAQALAHAAEAGKTDPWLEPSVMLEQVAHAFQAVTTAHLLPDDVPGLRAVVEPALGAMLADTTRRALLRSWLATLNQGDALSQAGTALLDLAQEFPKGEADQLRDELVRELDGAEDVVDALPLDRQLVLMQRLKAREAYSEADTPQVNRIMADIRSKLHDNTDYAGEVRAAFDVVLIRTLRFVADRMNVQLSGVRFQYLQRHDAKEEDLQQDYREWMIGNGLQGVVDIEVTGVAGGRVDVRFSFGLHRLITEVKRDNGPFVAGALDRHLNQAGIYQASTARLGILLVLDLSEKARGEMASLERSVWVTTKPALAQGDYLRHIVVFVVPGNRPLPPSKVTA
ncbi:MAG: hypothetical protein ABR549_14120, partial [Mycobacteriales bacterium]